MQDQPHGLMIMFQVGYQTNQNIAIIMCQNVHAATYKAEHEDEGPDDLVRLWLEHVLLLVIFCFLVKPSDGGDQGKDQTNEHNNGTDQLKDSGALAKQD